MRPVSATTQGGPGPRDAGSPAGPGARGASDLLARSARALAEHQESTWTQTRDRVVGAVRSASRGRVLLEADLPQRPDRAADRLQVSDQVVVATVATAVERASGARPLRIEVQEQDGVCTGASLHVFVPYGPPIEDVVREVRSTAVATITEVLGGADADHPVDVHVDEVHLPDQRD